MTVKVDGGKRAVDREDRGDQEEAAAAGEEATLSLSVTTVIF